MVQAPLGKVRISPASNPPEREADCTGQRKGGREGRAKRCTRALRPATCMVKPLRAQVAALADVNVQPVGLTRS